MSCQFCAEIKLKTPLTNLEISTEYIENSTISNKEESKHYCAVLLDESVRGKLRNEIHL